jgi:hypothetical protein
MWQMAAYLLNFLTELFAAQWISPAVAGVTANRRGMNTIRMLAGWAKTCRPVFSNSAHNILQQSDTVAGSTH